MNVRPLAEEDAPTVAALISAEEERLYGRPGRLTGADILMFLQYSKESWIWEEDGRTVGGLAERLSLESSTITPLVKRLELAGFLGRLRNPADERQVQVRLTERGRQMRAKTACLTQELLSRSGMKVEEIIALNRQVQALRDALAAELAAAG